MSEHTLGPWSVDGSPTTDFDVVCADGRIAMVNGEDWSADMTEANAYLLAAAPELLELARQIVLAAEQDEGQIPFDIVTGAKAAVVKAMGEIV
jgi:hypothetical protein